MADKIILHDGTEIENGYVSTSPLENGILCRIPGDDLVQAAIIFGNTAKTETITYLHTGFIKDIYVGYTKISDIGLNHFMHSVDVRLLPSESAEYRREYTVPEEYLPKELRPKNQDEA